MRPIEFRAQRADTREWVYGYLAEKDVINIPIHDETTGYHGYDDVLILPETVGQFTGLVDRNGKKIFEGDVLTWRCSKSGSTYEKNYTVVIEWPINAHSYSIVILDKKKRFATQRTYWNEAYSEVIGTIHDKPEKP